jgi:hypothetical protein
MKTLITAQSAPRIEKALRDRHVAALAADETFRLAGWRQKGRVVATLALEKSDGSRCYEMEAAMDVQPGRREFELLDICLDFLDWAVGRHLESERLDRLPLDWSQVRFGNEILWARGELRHPTLQREADALLRQPLSEPDDPGK